jgi:hypothetical protein
VVPGTVVTTGAARNILAAGRAERRNACGAGVSLPGGGWSRPTPRSSHVPCTRSLDNNAGISSTTGAADKRKDRRADLNFDSIRAHPVVCIPPGERSDELVAADGEELELVVAFAAGSGGEDQEGLGLVGIDEAVPVHFQGADPGMLHALGRAIGAHDRVLAPDLGELLAGLQQRVDKGAGVGVGAVASVRGEQVGGDGPAVPGVVLGGKELPFGGSVNQR